MVLQAKIHGLTSNVSHTCTFTQTHTHTYNIQTRVHIRTNIQR